MESFQLIIQYKIHKPLPKDQISQVNMPSRKYLVHMQYLETIFLDVFLQKTLDTRY